MKLIKFKTLRGRLVFWFLLLTLAPLLIALLVSYYQRVSAIRNSTIDKLTAIRDLKVERLKDWLVERNIDVSTFSEDNELTSLEYFMGKSELNQKDNDIIKNCRLILNRYLKNYSTYNELFIINPENGQILVSTKEYMEGEIRSTAEYFTKPMISGKLTFTDVFYSKELSDYTMIVSTPIFSSSHDEEHIVGIFVGRIDLNSSLYPMLLDRVGLGETGETLIVNKDVYAVNKLRWYDNAPLNLQISAEPAVRAANGETGIVQTKDYREEEVLAAYTYVPAAQWGFVCKQDMYELNAPIREMLWNFLLILIVSTGVIIFIALWLSKNISKPIITMSTTAKKMKAGDFSARNSIDSEDELGLLANEFNTMADVAESRMSIQKSISDISKTMIGKSDIKQFANSLLKRLMKITDADMSTFYILNEGSQEYEPFASVGANEEMLYPFSSEKPQGEFGNALSTQGIFYLKDIPDSTIFKFNTVAGQAIPKEIITVPIVVENSVVALISLVNIQKFRKESVEILEQSWISINTFYSNLITSERTRILAEHLSRMNQQLEAQSEELQEQAEELKDQTEELQHASEELQEQNLELEAQKKQVEAANTLKSEFLSNMSHELRTPLNSILALSRVLIEQANEKLDEEENNYLEIVERNGKRLLILINDILDLSKIEAGKMEIVPELFSFSSCLRIVKENLQSLAEEKGLKLRLDIAAGLPQIESDESRLHQVLTNIIGNAIKFTDEGEIKIETSYNTENVYVNVKDTGIGIAKEKLPTIFEEFRQADGSTSREYEGTGLGLAIAQKLIQVMGGGIEVESTLGKGSVFTVTIPIRWHDENVKLNPFHNQISSRLSKEKHIHRTPKTDIKSRILLVEDNEDAIIQVKSVLEKEKFVVDVATGGKEALEYITRFIPDGIILDLMMPEIDGFEVLEKLRATDKTKNIPVLILTAKDLTQKDRAKLSANNIQQLIHKGDVDISGLIKKVRLMLGNNPLTKPDSVKNTDRERNKNGLPKVLILEDNEDNMITIKAILKGKYLIYEAIDGEEGLNMAKSCIPDIVLLDMSLPKTGGLEILSSLKASKETKHIPIVAVTAQAMIGDKEKFIKNGCDGYVSKPIDQKELVSEINRLLS